jgi:hypothetical protein
MHGKIQGRESLLCCRPLVLKLKIFPKHGNKMKLKTHELILKHFKLSIVCLLTHYVEPVRVVQSSQNRDTLHFINDYAHMMAI